MFIFYKKIDEKLTKLNNRVTSNKAKHIDAENKLNDHIKFYTKVINDLWRGEKLISTKGLTEDLINGYNILNGTKYVVKDGSQNCLVFQPAFKYFTGNQPLLVLINPVISDNSFAPKGNLNKKVGAKFKGNCLIQDNVYGGYGI